MIGLLIAIFACIYFFIEAKKRGAPPFKWLVIAFVSFLGPQMLISWLLVPMVLIVMETPLDESTGTQLAFAFIGLGIGFYLLVVARKKLYRIPRIVPVEGAVVVKSLDIIENSDNTYTIGDKTFSSKSDAEQYAALLKGLM